MKEIQNYILKIILWIALLYISFVLVGCERSVTTTCELCEQYLFVEYNVLENWSTDDGFGLFITGGDYTFNNGVLDLRGIPIKPEIDNETKILIGERYKIARESGGGIVGGVKAS